MRYFPKRLGYISLPIGMLVALVTIPSAAQDNSISIYGEAIENWSGCNISPQPSTLTYCVDQVQYWADTMLSLGHYHWDPFWDNGDVWASDATEDHLGGTNYWGDDYEWADHANMYAYSGHGVAPTNQYGTTFQSPFCHPGSWSDAWFDSQNARFGETGNSPDATPHIGYLRWTLWLTCDSTEFDYANQWGESMWYGTDVIMGYRGLSADSSYTDEVGSDLASAAFGPFYSAFKPAWFWAMEDWWEDDIGGIITSGQTGDEAISRLNNLTWLTPVRPWGQFHGWMAAAWHVG